MCETILELHTFKCVPLLRKHSPIIMVADGTVTEHLDSQHASFYWNNFTISKTSRRSTGSALRLTLYIAQLSLVRW